MQRGKGYCLKLKKKKKLKKQNSILSWYCLTRNFIFVGQSFQCKKREDGVIQEEDLSVIFSLTNFWANNNRANTHISMTEQSAHHCIYEEQLRLNSHFHYAEAAPGHSLFPGVAGSTFQDTSPAHGVSSASPNTMQGMQLLTSGHVLGRRQLPRNMPEHRQQETQSLLFNLYPLPEQLPRWKALQPKT